jgi:hypothetical protein
VVKAKKGEIVNKTRGERIQTEEDGKLPQRQIVLICMHKKEAEVKDTCGGCGFDNRLQRLQSRSVQERGCLGVVSNIHEPVVAGNWAQNISRPLQAVLQLVVGGDVLYFVPKVGVGPELRIRRMRQKMMLSCGCIEDVGFGIQGDSFSWQSNE